MKYMTVEIPIHIISVQKKCSFEKNKILKLSRKHPLAPLSSYTILVPRN